MAADQNPKGEPHPYIPHLYKKPAPRTMASDFYPYLNSADQHRAKEEEKERKRQLDRNK